jgi:hypothetical protein
MRGTLLPRLHNEVLRCTNNSTLQSVRFLTLHMDITETGAPRFKRETDRNSGSFEPMTLKFGPPKLQQRRHASPQRPDVISQ